MPADNSYTNLIRSSAVYEQMLKSLRLSSPVTTIVTSEPTRTITILSQAVLDAGLERLYVLPLTQTGGQLFFYDNETNTFKECKIHKLQKNENNLEQEPSPISEPVPISETVEAQDAYSYVAAKGKGAILILSSEKPDFLVSSLYLELVDQANKYRTSFLNFDGSVPIISTFILTPTQELPPALTRIANTIDDYLPDRKQLTATVSNFVQHCTQHGLDALGKYKIEDVVDACVGMSETETISSIFADVANNSYIDVNKLNEMRILRLRQSANIDIIKPKISFETLGGMDVAKSLVKTNIKLAELKDPDMAPFSKVLLLGIPGCGKSALCEATANEMGLLLARTGVSQQLSKWIGESESNMRNTMRSIFAMSPICVWIDELGRDLSGSGATNDGGVTNRVHGEFLTALQEAPEDVFLVAAANSVDELPPEMLRHGRFDEIFFVGFPSHEERKEICSIYLKEMVEDVDLDVAASHCSAFTGSEIESAIRSYKVAVKTSQLDPGTASLVSVFSNTKNLVYVRSHDYVKRIYTQALRSWRWASTHQRKDAELVLSGEYNNHRMTNSRTQPSSRRSNKAWSIK